MAPPTSADAIFDIAGVISGTLEPEFKSLRSDNHALKATNAVLEGRVKELEKQLQSARADIKGMTEDKAKWTASRQKDLEDAKQEGRRSMAQGAAASKATMKMQLESEIGHMEEKVKTLNLQNTQLKEQVAHDTNENRSVELARELEARKERYTQQFSQLNQLGEKITNRETSDRITADLRALRGECNKLRQTLRAITLDHQKQAEKHKNELEILEGQVKANNDLERQNAVPRQNVRGEEDRVLKSISLNQTARPNNRKRRFSGSLLAPMPAKTSTNGMDISQGE